jgi:hypothetical protein
VQVRENRVNHTPFLAFAYAFYDLLDAPLDLSRFSSWSADEHADRVREIVNLTFFNCFVEFLQQLFLCEGMGERR